MMRKLNKPAAIMIGTVDDDGSTDDAADMLARYAAHPQLLTISLGRLAPGRRRCRIAGPAHPSGRATLDH
ncbi:hypothetical protein WT25_16895 [Burkholderia territorii]|uniref:hypothetical protein n=1 Tax=Burkholderia territorii TaxID=1503055 RepID=UPI00075A3B6C|nr:hypothetical protein [Burkholderia territorii]KVT80428.1 hypothetical protein WT25_16895 [Burkholderia territorii]